MQTLAKQVRHSPIRLNMIRTKINIQYKQMLVYYNTNLEGMQFNTLKDDNSTNMRYSVMFYIIPSDQINVVSLFLHRYEPFLHNRPCYQFFSQLNH